METTRRKYKHRSTRPPSWKLPSSWSRSCRSSPIQASTKTLTLAQIVSAQTQRGVFHENTFLTLEELASPHFLSRNATESFEVIDMVRTDDKSRSFAIDTFPEMSEESIEEFSIRNVERRRALREQAFEELELDACAAGLCDD